MTKPSNVGNVQTAMQRIRDELIPRGSRPFPAKGVATEATTCPYRGGSAPSDPGLIVDGKKN